MPGGKQNIGAGSGESECLDRTSFEGEGVLVLGESVLLVGL